MSANDPSRTYRVEARFSLVRWPGVCRVKRKARLIATQPPDKVLSFHSHALLEGDHMRRRELVQGIAGSAIAWPLAARAQRPERMRRVGLLMPLTADDPYDQMRQAAFLQGLEEAGWSVGRSLRIDTRWGGDSDRIRRSAMELVALAPDVILTIGTNTAVALQQATRTVPVVFTAVIDPTGAGLVESLAKPGGNMTGFTFFEFSTSAKWLELLKEIAPSVTRAAVLRDTSPSGFGSYGAIQGLAPSLGLETSPIGVQNADEIERAVAEFAHSSNGGLIVVTNGSTIIHRELIISLAARFRLPAVFGYRLFVTDGGLICYGPDSVDQCRRAAGYADRILRGEKPANLPVQEPTKYELVINLKTAKSLGLNVPPTLLARADEVIE
jgi:putative ABC transport system substrate-binding protein